jgi:hypothetical protein
MIKMKLALAILAFGCLTAKAQTNPTLPDKKLSQDDILMPS